MGHLLLGLVVSVCWFPVVVTAESTPPRPNVVLILADDLGWGSLGCYGANPDLVQTPRLDRLAKEGTRFTQAYVTASICTPSRYSLLTGRYCWRSSLKFEVIGTKDPLLIEPGRLTLASLLKKRGYNTAAIGKWHLGFGTQKPVDFLQPLRPGPLELGFDFYYGLASNHGDGTGVYLTTQTDSAGKPVVTVEGLRSDKIEPFGKSTYGSPFMGFDAPQRVDEDVMGHLTEKASSWIGSQTSEKPFFLYFAPVAVHGPITPSKTTAGQSKVGAYGDFIRDLDISVGKILDELDRRGLTQNTLVLFSSDNGGEDRNFAKVEREAIARGLALNGSLKSGKHSIYEGGLRVPYIIRWPSRVPADRTSDEPISLGDTLATLAALTGTSLPPADQAAEDSFNMLSAWLGQGTHTANQSVRIGHSGFGVYSVRKGPWKWIEGIPAKKNIKTGSGQYQPQLYNLDKDPGEQKNVIAEHPEIVTELAGLLQKFREQGHSRE